MNATFCDLIDHLKSVGRISADEALAVRRAIYDDTGVSLDEAAAMVALDEATEDRAAEWDELFVEAMVDVVVHQQDPRDYVDAAKADWLIRTFTEGGRVRTDSELEAIAHILEEATSVPPSLTSFALAQVKAAVLEGEGPLLRGGRMEKGRITAGDVEMLRRILFAAGGHGEAAITRVEAEILFDINDACRGAENDPAWPDFFARAVAASVLTASGYQPMDAGEVVREEAWLNSKSSFLGFARSTLHLPGAQGAKQEIRERAEGALEDILHPDADYQRAWNAKNSALATAEAGAEVLNDDEARWLVGRIGRGGAPDAAERQLIAFVKQNASQISPLFQPLLDGAATDEAPAVAPTFGRRQA
ncbi:MAG: hypothetical protein ACHP7N_09880 [Caulobacterales bacterium]